MTNQTISRLPSLWGVLLFLGMLIMSGDAGATLYRWTDKSGEIHYSTTPPTLQCDNLEVKRNNAWYPYPGTLEVPEKTVRVEVPVQAVVDYSVRNKTVIIIEVTVNRKFKKHFIVDTGASYTTITSKLAKILELTPNPEIPPMTIQTANGKIEAPLVNLDSIAVDRLESPNVVAAIHDFHDSPQIAGLLGLNFLNRFKMTVDSTHHQLTFEPLRPLEEFAERNCIEAREWVAKGVALDDDSDEEASYYKRAIDGCPDLLEAHYYLGDVYYAQEQYQRAIQVYLEILQLQPDEPEAHFRLGVLYAHAKKYHQARLEFKNTLKLNPDHEKAKEFLEQLTP